MFNRNLNLVGVKKGEEHYLVLYPERRKRDALRSIEHMAQDSEMNFSWTDAQVVSQSINRLRNKHVN